MFCYLVTSQLLDATRSHFLA